MDLDIKIKDGKFHFGFSDKRLISFFNCQNPDKSSNVPSSAVYSAIGAESLRIAGARSDPESFSTAIKPLIACMSRQKVSIAKINSVILNFLTNMKEILMFVNERKNCYI